jgi:hypothetical protein
MEASMSDSSEHAAPRADDKGSDQGISAATPVAALGWPPQRPGEIDEDETASEPPDAAHDDSHHWPRPKDDGNPADRRRESED